MTIYNLWSWLQLKLSLRDAYRYLLCHNKHQWYKTTTKFKSILLNNYGTYEINKLPCIKCKRCGKTIFLLGEVILTWYNICKSELKEYNESLQRMKMYSQNRQPKQHLINKLLQR